LSVKFYFFGSNKDSAELMDLTYWAYMNKGIGPSCKIRKNPFHFGSLHFLCFGFSRASYVFTISYLPSYFILL